MSSVRFLASDWLRSLCMLSTSMICSPTRSTGFSAVIGSWKIIAMRRARNWRIWAWLALVISKSSSVMLPPCTSRADFGSSPMAASEVTDLPEPDSPTKQCVSPARIVRSMPSITGLACGRPLNPMRRSRTLSTSRASEKSLFLNCISQPSRFFMRGSSRSRAVSPRRLIDRMQSDSSRPGQKISPGLI